MSGAASGNGLVGRAAEVGALATATEEAAAGSLRTCLVSGPPGVGKTALLHAVFDGFHSNVKLWACGNEDEQSLSYGVIEQLGLVARGALRGREPGFVEVGAEVMDGIVGASGDGCRLIVVDDLQWADRSSLHALNFALRRLRADPVLVVMSCRTENLEHLPRGTSQLLADHGAHLRLGPLNVDDLMQLLVSAGLPALSRPAAKRLERHTGGNPLYALTIMQELSTDVLENFTHTPLPAPRLYSSLIVARLGHCAPGVETSS